MCLIVFKYLYVWWCVGIAFLFLLLSTVLITFDDNRRRNRWLGYYGQKEMHCQSSTYAVGDTRDGVLEVYDESMVIAFAGEMFVTKDWQPHLNLSWLNLVKEYANTLKIWFQFALHQSMIVTKKINVKRYINCCVFTNTRTKVINWNIQE